MDNCNQDRLSKLEKDIESINKKLKYVMFYVNTNGTFIKENKISGKNIQSNGSEYKRTNKN